MEKNLFVGNLSWGVDAQLLEEAFAQFGEITKCMVITDRETGRSRGFGFVTFADGADADAAIEAMDGADLDGRAVVVNEARPREERPRYND